jgi:hypothetical protein
MSCPPTSVIRPRAAIAALHPMAQTSALLTKTKVFPDGKKGSKKCLSAYGKRIKKFFEKVGF